jgi:DNA repair protein RecO
VPLYRSEALVLRTYRYGEADRIVVFLTRDRGKKRGVAKNALKSRRRFMGGLEPMTRGRAVYFEREHRELVRLDAVEPMRSPLAAAEGNDPAALAHIGYFAELLDEWTPDADPHEALFRLGAAMVEALVAGAPTAPLARYFEYWLLRLQGVYPEARGTLSSGAMSFLAASRAMAPSQVGELPAARGVLRELEGVHRALITMHLEKSLKSDRVLRDLRRHS